MPKRSPHIEKIHVLVLAPRKRRRLFSSLGGPRRAKEKDLLKGKLLDFSSMWS